MRHFSWIALITISTKPVALVAQNALESSGSLHLKIVPYPYKYTAHFAANYYLMAATIFHLNP